MTAKTHYQQIIQQVQKELLKVRKVLAFLFGLRLFLFLLFSIALIFFFIHDHVSLLILSMVGLGAFLLVVKLDLQYAFRKKYLTNQRLLNEKELDYLDHHYQDAPTGKDFSALNPHLAGDFDLFGAASLFQYLNRCSTRSGMKTLAQMLAHPMQKQEEILQQASAIRELSQKTKLLQEFRTHGMFLKEEGKELENLMAWLDQPQQQTRCLTLAIWTLPAFNVLWLILVILGIFSFQSFLLPALVSLMVVFANLKKINKAHAWLGRSARILEQYVVLFKIIEQEEFRSTGMKKLQQQLIHQGVRSGDSIKGLFRLLSNFDLRLNIIPALIMNALVLWDLQVFYRLECWKQNHRHLVGRWFSAIARADALMGCATYAFNNLETVTYPNISGQHFTYQAVRLGHPLLHPQARVCNDVSFEGSPQVVIITGANMAGKSTFLRTLAINAILAMNGLPVCAQEMTLSPFEILSSIIIKDSLANSESYFYAELVRLNEIIDRVKHNPRSFIVLDEILRGTNTDDKLKGSLGLLENLIGLQAVVILATHNLTIGELQNKYPEVVTNKCFEVELINDQLVFDYKLKEGVSQKLNASFLMKKMGIIK